MCTCYDGYAAEDCSEVVPMQLTHKQKKSAMVVCEADNLYTYTPASFPANVTFAMQVASDPLSGELSALLAVTTNQVSAPLRLNYCLAGCPAPLETHTLCLAHAHRGCRIGRLCTTLPRRARTARW